MSRIKVLHVIGSMDLGGAEKLTKLMIEGLGSAEFESAVCCLKSGGHYAQELSRRGVPVHVMLKIGKHDRVGLVDLIRTSWRLWRLLRREKPDVVHSHLFLASVLTRMVGWLAGRRCQVVTLHRIEYPRWQPMLERILAGLARCYVTDSQAAARLLIRDLGVAERKVEFIHNGIDPAEFGDAPSLPVARARLGLEPGGFVVGIIAHLYQEKGHAFLLDSLAAVRAGMGDFQLLVVGDGYLRDSLEQQAARLFPEGRVIFLGQRSDLAAVLASLDVMVLPSRWEGFGIILAEAMYMRVPVITTRDGGGSAEVVAENDGGLLVSYGDRAELGRALVRFRGDGEFRRLQGQRGRARVEGNFLAAVMVAKYAAMYRRLFARAPRRSAAASGN